MSLSRVLHSIHGLEKEFKKINIVPINLTVTDPKKGDLHSRK
jgi:hypothetical protein